MFPLLSSGQRLKGFSSRGESSEIRRLLDEVADHLRNFQGSWHYLGKKTLPRRYGSISLCWRTWSLGPEIGDRPDSDLPEVIIQTDKAESRGHDFGCDGPRKKWVVILPRSRQILIHAYKKMLALPKVSRAGGGVVFHHVAFWRHNSNACFLLIFWMKGTERDERVSRFLDESDKGYAVLLFILAQRKEIKKKISWTD